MDSPAVGLGTMLLKESCQDAVATALEVGCKIIDTGEHYGNLELIGTALKAAGRKPFIVLKLSGIPAGDYDVFKGRVTAMLTKLGIDKASCLLIHWPGLCDWDPTDMSPLSDPSTFQEKAAASTWECFCENIAGGWANMTKLKEEGLVDKIGTSNFYPHHLQELAKQCPGAVPFANEIFISATNQERDFVNQMQAMGICVLAYRPVMYKPFPEAIVKIAERLSTSPQSIVLGWLLKRGISPLVKARGAHIAENCNRAQQMKDMLTAEDLESIAEAELGMKLAAEWFAKKWKFHNEAPGGIDEEHVQMLMGLGVDEAKARESLETCGGDLDAAMEIAFT
jgi:diketogulonate reductase-like aldo/keto reductase